MQANEQELVHIEELEPKVAPDQSTAGFLDRKKNDFEVRGFRPMGFLD